MLDEVVKSIDALSREQLVLLVSRLGLQGVQLPVLLPGAKQAFVPLSPSLSEEDRRVVENVVKIGEGKQPPGVPVLARWLGSVANHGP